jgi:tetratricopeptide (TPR) repeat protein
VKDAVSSRNKIEAGVGIPATVELTQTTKAKKVHVEADGVEKRRTRSKGTEVERRPSLSEAVAARRAEGPSEEQQNYGLLGRFSAGLKEMKFFYHYGDFSKNPYPTEADPRWSTYNTTGIYMSGLGKLREAALQYEANIADCTKAGDLAGLRTSYSNLAHDVDVNRGDFEAMLHHAQQAYACATELTKQPDRDRAADLGWERDVSIEIGWAHHRLGQTAEAKEAFDRADALGREQGVSAVADMWGVYRARYESERTGGDADEAMRMLQAMHDAKPESPHVDAQILGELAYLQQRSDPDAAARSFREAFEKVNKTDANTIRTELYLLRGSFLLDQGLYSKAVADLKTASKDAGRYGMGFVDLEARHLITEAKEQLRLSRQSS